MRSAQIAAFTALALAAGTAEAQLYKCVQGGRTVYQDSPCDDAAKQSTLRAPSPSYAPPPAAPAGAGKAPASAPVATPASVTSNALEVVAGFAVCSERVPNFQRKYSEAFGDWKARNAAAVGRLANEPDASQLDARLREERARPESESLADHCAGIATMIQPPREAGLPKVAQ